MSRSPRRRSRLAHCVPLVHVVCAGLFLLMPFTMSRAAEDTPPKVIVLTPEKYKELLDEIARLKGQLKPEKPVPPSSCKVSGKLDGDVVHLMAEFGFAASPTRTLVLLGCRQGNPTAATLDGGRPLLQWGEDGWLVQVNGLAKADAAPAGHELKLFLDVPVGSRGNDRLLELSLPGAAITLIDFDLSHEAKSVHLRGQVVATRPAAGGRRRLERALGAVESLSLTWPGTPAHAGVKPLLVADGRLSVRVTETVTTTRAELTLRSLGGATDQYRLLVPPLAEVRRHPADDPQKTNVQAIEVPDPNKPLRIVHLKEATADPVLVEVQFSQSRTANSPVRNPIVVRPFVLEGADRQRGTILISKAPDLQLRYHTLGEPQATVSQREVTTEQRQRDPNLAAAFDYWSVLAPESPALPAAPLLELEVDRPRQVVEAHVTHHLTLTRNAADGTLVWSVKTQLDVTPSSAAGVDALRLQLPPADQFDAKLDDVQPTRLVQGVEVVDVTRRIVRLSLERQNRPFSLFLEGTYRALDPDVLTSTLKLPRPQVSRDRGADVKVTLPAEEFRLVRADPDDPPWDAQTPDSKPESGSDGREHSWNLKQAPEQVNLAWRSYRPELPVMSTVSVFLSGRQARIEQRLAFGPSHTPGEMLLRVPQGLVPRLRLGGLGALQAVGALEQQSPTRAGFEIWRVNLDGKKVTLPWTFNFSVPLPDAKPAREPGEENSRQTLHLDVPLVRPEKASRMETTVHVWGPVGTLLSAPGEAWEEQPVQVVAGQDSLPDLTLHGSTLDAPLALNVNEPTADALATGLVERALVRVTVGEDGSQLYRASLLLRRRPRSSSLLLDLPALASNIRLETSLLFNRDNGASNSQSIGWQPVDDRAQVVNVSRTVRLDLDGVLLAHRPAVLEVQYQLSPDLTRSGSGALQSTLQPPLVRNDAGRFPVQWQIWLPAHWLALSQRGGLAAERHWGWRGWLLGPQSALSAPEMERWFYPEGMPLRIEGATPALAVSAFSLEPVRISHVPRQAWLALCSGALLVVGLGLYVVPWPRVVLWSAAVVAALAVMGIGLFSPSLFMDVLYGCEPGVLALLLVLGVQWVLHQRYRRQVVFMPGFQRRKSGSSLVRTGGSSRPRGEPSTVDALPPGDVDPWAASAPRAEGSSRK